MSRVGGKIRETREVKAFLQSLEREEGESLPDLRKERGANKKDRKLGVRKTRWWEALIVGVAMVVSLTPVVAAGALWENLSGFFRQIGDGRFWDFITADPNEPLKTDGITGRTNILVFGVSGWDMEDTMHDGGLTDSIMVISLDQESGDVKTISIPRDLRALNGACTATAKINELYPCVFNQAIGQGLSQAGIWDYQRRGAENLKRGVEEVIGLPIQYWVYVNWSGLVGVVDALGGIDVRFLQEGVEYNGEEVVIRTSDPRGLADAWNPRAGSWYTRFENNRTYRLHGEQALGVARARNHDFGSFGAGGGNFSRELFQQQIILATVKRAREANLGVGQILAIQSAIGDNIRMNFTGGEIRTLIRLGTSFDMANFTPVPFVDIANNIYYMTNGSLTIEGMEISFVWPTAGLGIYGEIHAYIRRALSLDPIAQEAAVIDFLNGSGINGAARQARDRLWDANENITAGRIGDANSSDYAGYTLYALSTSSPRTKAWLEQFNGVTAQTASLPVGIISTADFVVIVGRPAEQ